MAKSEKAKAGCFSSFLEVLLCAGNGTSPPVHPSDHVTESDETELLHLHSNKDATLVDDYAASTPGVVARLMGLESLPKTSLLTKGATPDSVPRSRSVNFVDYLLEFDLNHANNHRRVKTSASFREVPALVQRKNSDLVVLYWDENERKDEEARCNLKKKEMGLEELKEKKKKQGSKNKEVLRERVVSVKKEWNQGKNKKISKLKNEPRRVPSSRKSRMVRNNHHCEARDFSSVSSSSESCSYRYSGAGSTSSSNSTLQSKKNKGFVEPKFTDNKRNQKSPKTMETEYYSENLSSVSAVDTNDYPFLHGTDLLDRSYSTGPLVAKSKWKSSSLLSLGDGVEERTSNNEDSAYTDLNRGAGYYSELILKLRTLTENDIRESDITSKKGIYDNEDFEEICYMFENRILDLLLHEFVNEVVQLSC